MTLEVTRDFLAWCTVIDYALLIIWWLMFTLARGFVYRVHAKMFGITQERLEVINYSSMIAFKMAIFVFNLVPYLALRIVG